MNREDLAALYNLYHLARTALEGNPSRYDRKLYAVREFEKAHPRQYSNTRLYLAFERTDAGLVA